MATQIVAGYNSGMEPFNVNIAMPGYVGPLDLGDDAKQQPAQQIANLDSPDAILQLVAKYCEQDSMTAAIELLHQGIEKFPDSVPLRHRLINCYTETTQTEDARRQILSLRDLGYKDPEFLALVGSTLMGMREFAAAIESFREAKANGAPAKMWLLQYAEVLLRTGHRTEAEAMLDHFQKVGDRQSVQYTRSRVLLTLAKIRVRQGRYREAVDICLKAALNARKMKTSTLDNTFFFYLGLAEFRRENFEKAKIAFETFLKNAPRRVAPYRFLERIAREADDDEQADDYLLKASQLLEDSRLLRYEKRKLES